MNAYAQSFVNVSESLYRETRTKKFRAWNPESKMFLHISGDSETPAEDFAWYGTAAQFAQLDARKQLTEPYTLVRRTHRHNPQI